MKKPPKFVITEKVEEVSPYDFESTLGSLALKIEAWIHKYGSSARLDWSPDHWFRYDTSPSPRFFVLVDRDETDEEYKLRVSTLKLVEKAQVEKDLAELKRLKTLYKDVE
jgi:hypothetical protein